MFLVVATAAAVVAPFSYFSLFIFCHCDAWVCSSVCVDVCSRFVVYKPRINNIFDRLGIVFNLRCKLEACNGNLNQKNIETNKPLNSKQEEDSRDGVMLNKFSFN